MSEDKLLGKKETYTDDDIIQNLELEKNRQKSFRPSLRHFWLNLMKTTEAARLYRNFSVDE